MSREEERLCVRWCVPHLMGGEFERARHVVRLEVDLVQVALVRVRRVTLEKERERERERNGLMDGLKREGVSVSEEGMAWRVH